MLSEIRRRSSSISRIRTQTSSPGLDDLARALDVVLGELGDVDEALDAGDDLDEGAERDDLGHLALEDVAGPVLVEHPLPRVLLGLLEPERDPLAVAVDVEHLDPHRLADREHLRGMVDVAPGELGDVDQAVDPVEVDEGAEVDDVRDLALDDGPAEGDRGSAGEPPCAPPRARRGATARRCCGCGSARSPCTRASGP